MNYRDILHNIFKERALNNSNYSLRAFAKSLHCSPSYLSEVLNNKRTFSEKLGNSILSYLDLDERLSECFMRSIAFEIKEFEKKNLSKKSEYLDIEESCFSGINRWQYFALMSAINLKDYSEKDISVLGEKFFLEIEEVELMLRELTDNKFIFTNNEGFFETNTKRAEIKGEFPSASIREFHVGVLDEARASLDTLSFEERFISSNILTCKKEDMLEIKEYIQNFRKKFARKFAGDTKAKELREVFAMNISFIPLEGGKV